MKKKIFIIVIPCLLFILGCTSQEKKWEEVSKSQTITDYESYLKKFPTGTHAKEAKTIIINLKFQKYKEELIKAISLYIQNEKGFKSLESIDLLQAEEINLANSDTLKSKKNYIVWKALAKVKHNCNRCAIQESENNVALFIITQDQSNHFEAFLRLKKSEGLIDLLNSSRESEITFRYSHTTSVELSEGKSMWTIEEYSYPEDLHPSNIPITKVDNVEIDKADGIIEYKAPGIVVTWNKKTKDLKINDMLSSREVLLKKGDKQVSFDDYFNFVEGRRIKFIVE